MKIKFWMLLICVFSDIAFSASPVDVHFHGTISDASCQLDPDSTSLSIDLGSIYNKDLADAGTGSSWKSADIKLINCPTSLKTITAKFTGTPDTDDPTLYKNLEDSLNVSVELQDRNTQLELGNNSEDSINTDSSGAAIFNLRARAKTVNGNATPGNIKSIIEVTFSYK